MDINDVDNALAADFQRLTQAEPEDAGVVDVEMGDLLAEWMSSHKVAFIRAMLHKRPGDIFGAGFEAGYGDAIARAERLAAEMERLACEWVDSAFRQTDLHSIPGDASAGALRLCAEHLRERYRAALAGDAPGRGEED